MAAASGSRRTHLRLLFWRAFKLSDMLTEVIVQSVHLYDFAIMIAELTALFFQLAPDMCEFVWACHLGVIINVEVRMRESKGKVHDVRSAESGAPLAAQEVHPACRYNGPSEA